MQNLYFIVDLTDSHSAHYDYRGAVEAVCLSWKEVEKYFEALGTLVLVQLKGTGYPVPPEEGLWDFPEVPGEDTNLHMWIMNPEKSPYGLFHYKIDVVRPWTSKNPRRLRYMV